MTFPPADPCLVSLRLLREIHQVLVLLRHWEWSVDNAIKGPNIQESLLGVLLLDEIREAVKDELFQPKETQSKKIIGGRPPPGKQRRKKGAKGKGRRAGSPVEETQTRERTPHWILGRRTTGRKS